MTHRLQALIGSFFCMSSVALGAFGAHGLKNILSSYALGVFETGVRYQFYHGTALLLLAVLGHVGLCKYTSKAAWCFVVGTVVFSGSLYLLAISGIKSWGAVTPIGGMLWLIGWGLTMRQIYLINKA